MTIQLLFVSQNASTRKLYHRLLAETEFELVPAKSVADALVQLVALNIQILIVDETLPRFELTMLLKVIQERGGWKIVRVMGLGYDGVRHLFPQDTVFVEGEGEKQESDFVRKLKEVADTL